MTVVIKKKPANSEVCAVIQFLRLNNFQRQLLISKFTLCIIRAKFISEGVARQAPIGLVHLKVAE